VRVNDRYTVISCDGHAGAPTAAYREYLPSRLHDEFDRWLAASDDDELTSSSADERNWTLDRRFADLEADGIVAEVIYPNTVTPFAHNAFSSAHIDKEAVDPDLRWEGLRAYNRWLVDWCASAPERLAGMCQISLFHPEESASEIRAMRDAGLRGGVLLPGIVPGSPLPPYHDPEYEPIWTACDDTATPLNHHGGSAAPHYGTHPGSTLIFLAEVGWFSHRALTFFVLGGVLERHPNLHLVLSEQAAGWVPGHLEVLERYAAYGELVHDASGDAHLSRSARQYWADQCAVAASFMAPPEAALRHEIGVECIMWGADYPHGEGTWPYSRESLRLTFAGVPVDEIRAMVGGNAARRYGFDLDALEPLAAQFGPTVEAIAEPLIAIPTDTYSPAFDPYAGAR
jgi:predicted TIM-barrel fold metal-dependent hydrolase